MTFSRFLYPAGVLFLLGACGGDDAEHDAAPGAAPPAQAADSATAPQGTDDPGVPAFVTDSAPAGGSGSAGTVPGSPTVPGDSAAPVDPAAAVRSVYTPLEGAPCRLVERDEESGATTHRCPGTAGYALLVHDFDARMTVDLVAPGGRTHRLRYSGVITSAFSSLGPRAEWRMRGATPVALIVRVNAFENPDTPDRATSYLAVARMGAREACVTDRIPPTTPNANEAARQAADRSAARPCMRDLAEQRRNAP